MATSVEKQNKWLMHKGHFTLRFKQDYLKQHYVEIDIRAIWHPHSFWVQDHVLYREVNMYVTCM